MSRERPILMSGPMVRAILEGQKTQTRRLVTSVSGFGRVTQFGETQTNGYLWAFRDHRGRWHDLRDSSLLERSPYGVPGDRLWVRETWGVSFHEPARDEKEALQDARNKVPWAGIVYGTDRAWETPARWRPSIHMPRWASRITLEVTAVRVERLHAITEDDARAEGVEGCTVESWSAYDPETQSYPEFMVEPTRRGLENIRHHVRTVYTARDAFARLWYGISGKRAPWAANPWVWVVEFRRTKS